MRKNKAEAELTVKALIDIGRIHFTEKGYAGVALEEIAQEAGLTRGAVYHHFKNKKGLFLAVFEAVQQEVGERVEREAEKSADMWQQLINGCRGFLAAAVEWRNRRILLIDGPSVLGWDTFRMLDEQNSMKSLKEQLTMMQASDLIKPAVSIDALTHCLSGAINEAALWIAENPDAETAMNEAEEALLVLLEGFRSRP